MSVRKPIALVLGLLIVLPALAARADEEVEIFNGKDLTGWTKKGGTANYKVEDGVIIGSSVPNTINTFLVTEKEYGDFVLELDFKIDDRTFNSGIQIRSDVRPEKGQERVYGYQIEIDPRVDRKWTGGVYYEAGGPHREKMWLNDLSENEAAREAFKLGDWNHIKIKAQGRRIQTWLNGVPAADYTDNDEKAFTPTGFIGLQVHQVGGTREPKVVSWKNIKLTTLDGSAAAANAPAAASSEAAAASE